MMARVLLLEALKSDRDDIRVRAGSALAKHGEEKAYEPLYALASALEPEDEEKVPEWRELVCLALQGLGWLGDPRSQDLALRLMHGKHEAIVNEAAQVLVVVLTRGDHGRSPTVVAMVQPTGHGS